MGMMLDEARPDWLKIEDNLYRDLECQKKDRIGRANLPVAVIIECDGVKIWFKNKKKAADYLGVAITTFAYHFDNGRPFHGNIFIRRAL